MNKIDFKALEREEREKAEAKKDYEKKVEDM